MIWYQKNKNDDENFMFPQANTSLKMQPPPTSES